MDSIIKSMKQKLKEKHKILGQLDSVVSDVYHYIEFNSFNACQGYLLSKKLKEALIERRSTKESISELEACLHTVQNKQKEMKQRSDERIKKYKKEVDLKNILG